jgi:hypothetical protein
MEDAPHLPNFVPPLNTGDTGAIIISRHALRPATQWPDGQREKIFAAVRGLHAAGQLPPLLNLADIRKRCDGWLKSVGRLRAPECPSDSSYRRHLPVALAMLLGISDTD